MTELQNLEKELFNVVMEQLSLNTKLVSLKKLEIQKRTKYIEFFFKDDLNLDVCKMNTEENADVFRVFTPTFYTKKEFYKFINQHCGDFRFGDSTNKFNFTYKQQNHYCRNEEIFNDLKKYNDKMEQYKSGYWFNRTVYFYDVLKDGFIRDLFKFELENDII
jgi:hypothetical protein